MLSIRPPYDPVVLPSESSEQVRLPLTFDTRDLTLVEIVIAGQPDGHALVHAAPRRRRHVAAHVALAAVAVVVCTLTGFAAGMILTRIPSPAPPAPPAALATVESWLAATKPPRAQELAVVNGVDSAAAYAGWVASSGSGEGDLRVRLVRTDAAPATLAIEMKREPRMSMLRAVSPRAFDLDIGPVAGPIRAQELAAAAGGHLVKHVSIRGRTAPGGRQVFVRARVTLHAPAAGNVRVVGRTVYVDLAAPGAAQPSASAGGKIVLQPHHLDEQKPRIRLVSGEFGA